ncbi:energy-coupling factor transporter transmembrane protein EcfT [Bacillus sp. S3]|uniref:energy-coupling factor transporter transmembrane component T family protein n=1 Tax=Bacillus sp. S3 TaxID=486398 RepID=UPI00118B60BD|nr:energy-coupling factor transporter transmembrane component T [Bacillus sp. S3]QCJ44725.1 energy-coupling factor transporter transmembrane protein EcfT [Bacillus sp. S3]
MDNHAGDSAIGLKTQTTNNFSFLKGMNLYSKFAIFIGFIAIAIVINNPIHLLPVFFLALIMCLSAGVSVKALAKTVKGVSGIFLILFIFSSFIYDVTNAQSELAKQVYFVLWEAKFIKIGLTSGGMLTGSNFILKMLIMIFASNLFSQTTTIEEMLFGLNRMGLPYQFGLMLSIALRFIPTLKKEVEQIQQAQKSRGASNKKKANGKKGAVVKGVIPLFVPMIVSSMRRSDTMAMSMTSRGYGYTNKRTQLLDIKFGIPQLIFILFIIGGFALCLYVKSKYGFGVL